MQPRELKFVTWHHLVISTRLSGPDKKPHEFSIGYFVKRAEAVAHAKELGPTKSAESQYKIEAEQLVSFIRDGKLYGMRLHFDDEKAFITPLSKESPKK